MTKTTKKRGPKRAVINYLVTAGDQQITVDLNALRVQVGKHLASIKDKSTWDQMAERVSCDGVTGKFMSGLRHDNGKLTVDQYEAMRDTFGWQDHEILLSDAERTKVGSNVIKAFPPASVARTTEDEPVDWSRMLAALIETNFVSATATADRYCAVLRGEDVMPARELVLRAVMEEVGSHTGLAQAWQTPPLRDFLQQVTAFEWMFLEDIIEQRIRVSQTA